MNGQINILDEIIVDNFAGGGGASTGIELAAGRPVTIAINHDPAAILMHKTNHPYTQHLQASVWDVDPVEVCAGRPVGLAWFSPDCKHFSKAKGSALVDRNIRGLAWIVLRWAGTVRPRVIILENVEEFQTWGPVRKGKPVKSKRGKTFEKWLSQLRELKYDIEHRELVAADYGAPTTRKRFVLIARCDGKKIIWPERTHAPKDHPLVKSGKCRPWRAAAEIIDWTLPMYSVFASKEEIKEIYGVKVIRPLAENTMRRIIRGVDKFTIKSGKPFIVECNHSGGGHLAGLHKPLGTVTQKHTAGLCAPLLAPVTFPNTCNSIGAQADKPIFTITTAGNQVLAAASLMSIGHTYGGDRIRSLDVPSPTAVSKQEACIVAANLIQYHTEKSESTRVNAPDALLPTVDTSNRYALTAAHLVEYYSTGRALEVSEPMHTVTVRDREAITAVHIQKYFGGVVGAEVSGPLPTVTVVDRNAPAAAHLVKFKGQEYGAKLRSPLQTITAINEFALASVSIVKYSPDIDLGYWPQIRELLNRYCDYTLGTDEVLLINIGDAWYYINDIAMRMLTPSELYLAMGFPTDYIIDHDYTGRPYHKKHQVARCGNAVCPPMAAAVVRANFPEWAVDIGTMEQLTRCIAM